ncbi:MAG: dUTP diphosphatase [Ruminococcus sp.]|nr:dUTP diphosphatase [Ruminococcus sp.]
MNHILKIKKLNDKAVVPKQATRGSAGMDLSACLDEDVVIRPGEIKMIPTGLSAAPDTDECALLIYARSGLACKHGIAPANCVGVVDSDYRGEIKVALINHGNEDFVVTNEMRIAQLVMTPVIIPQICEVSELDETERNAGGFGSTGQ